MKVGSQDYLCLGPDERLFMKVETQEINKFQLSRGEMWILIRVGCQDFWIQGKNEFDKRP